MENQTPSQSNQAPEAVQPQNPTLPSQPTTSITSKSSYKRKLIMLGIILLGLILLASLGGVYFLNQKTSQIKTATTAGNIKPTTAPASNSSASSGQDAANATANWKTYTNSALTFKFPNTWNVLNEIIKGTNPNIQISIAAKNGTLMNECMKVSSTETKNGIFVERFSKITTGAMCSGGDANLREIWIISNKDVYAPGISYSYSVNDEAKALNIFNQILSTFKFTEQTSQNSNISPTSVLDNMVNWKAYTDTDYPFQIKYPSDWTLRTTYGKSVNNLGNNRIAGIDLDTGSQSNGSVLVVNIIDSQGKSLEDWLRTNMSNAYTPTKTTFQGNLAYRYQYQTQSNKPDTVEIYYMYKNKIVFLSWDLISTVDQPTADQIMSTLKFNQ